MISAFRSLVLWLMGTERYPTAGDVRTIHGIRCRFTECELEGAKWVVIDPAAYAR